MRQGTALRYKLTQTLFAITKHYHNLNYHVLFLFIKLLTKKFRLWSSGLWHQIVLWAVTDVSEELAAYTFKVDLYREDGGSKLLRNVGKHQQDYTLSQPIRRESKPVLSNIFIYWGACEWWLWRRGRPVTIAIIIINNNNNIIIIK
jgi:hypothetical protein